MSAIAAPLGAAHTRARLEPGERVGVRLAAFAGLSVYGALAWGRLLTPQPRDRLLAYVALASAIVALAAWSRLLALIALAGSALAAFAIAGIQGAWVTHLRVAASARVIGDGIGGLPRVLLPYNGINSSIRVVTLLGAGVLLLGAAGILASAKGPPSDVRRAFAALPLLALAVVPQTLEHPKQPYLAGLLLFVLLAAFTWGERVSVRRLPAATLLLALGAAVAVGVAPSVSTHKPWVNYEALAGGLAPGHVESFDWSQRYGPLNWPRTGRQVFAVSAPHPEYWKAEDLDVFDGRGWMSGSVQLGNALGGVSPRAMARWTQTLAVTIRGMQTSDLIAAGVAGRPAHLSSVVLPGAAPGTWSSGSQLGPGDSYTVRAYVPQPSAAELAALPGGRGAFAAGPSPAYRALELPPTAGAPTQPVVFAPYGAGAQLDPVPGQSDGAAADAIASSPYARAYSLARSLAGAGATEIGFVASVQRYLSRGFTYDEQPPPRHYPLASFLFTDKRGYCQQFAGAMALLLRMGGVPARVAVGFTSGAYDASTRSYIVSDIDAHAWVEAWFPRYGWVTFDPTPTSDPARGGAAALPAIRDPHGRAVRARATHRSQPAAPTPRPRPASTPRAAGGDSGWAIALAALLLLSVIAAFVFLRAATPASAEGLVGELERALRRCGRPAPPAMTLQALEHRFRDCPEAAGYIRAVRLLRYRGAGTPPSAAGRRALRVQLRRGLGALGPIQALWALPPRRAPRALD